MKKLCLFLLVVCFTVPVRAQQEKGFIYMKNGTILKGKYQYSSDFKKLKVISAGNLWVFEAEEVDSISNISTHRLYKFEDGNKNTPYFLRAEIGVLAGNAENSQAAPFSFSSSFNYMFNRKMSAGVGLGLEFLKETYLPVFLNFEYRLRSLYSTPYFFLKGGYQVPIEESHDVYYDVYPMWSSFWPGPDYYNQNMDPKGGVLINPGLGYQRMFSQGFGMTFAFGYQYHRLHYKGENDYGLDIDYNRLTIKIGIIFN